MVQSRKRKKERAGVKGMQSIKDAQQMDSEKKRQTDEEEQMRNKKLERQTLLTHRDLYQISKSDRKSSFGVASKCFRLILCYVIAKKKTC